MPLGLPPAAFFRPSAYKDWKFEKDFYRRAYGASTVVHLTHKDCMDGATCDVLVRRAYGPGAVETVFLEPHETADALELMLRVPSRARGLVVSDLSLQRGEGDRVAQMLQQLSDDGWRISWRDHHHKQWEGVDLAQLHDACDLTVETQGQECGASLVQRALLPNDAWAAELARLARDHDLWLRQDSRSIALFHSLVEVGNDRWIRHMLAEPKLLDATLQKWAARDRAKNADQVKWALLRSRVVRGERARIALAYGRVPTNETLHALQEQGAHLAILVKPTGAFSLRSRKDVPVCHTIAQEFGGGGHPNASGGHLGLGAFGLASLWARRLQHRAARAIARRAAREVDEWLRAHPDALATRRG